MIAPSEGEIAFAVETAKEIILKIISQLPKGEWHAIDQDEINPTRGRILSDCVALNTGQLLALLLVTNFL